MGGLQDEKQALADCLRCILSDTQVAALGDESAEDLDQADTLAAREQTLRMELDDLRNPQRVAEEAQSMGMVIPAAPVFLDLRTGKTTGVRTPSTPDDAIQLLPPAPPKPAILAPPR